MNSLRNCCMARMLPREVCAGMNMSAREGKKVLSDLSSPTDWILHYIKHTFNFLQCVMFLIILVYTQAIGKSWLILWLTESNIYCHYSFGNIEIHLDDLYIITIECMYSIAKFKVLTL